MCQRAKFAIVKEHSDYSVPCNVHSDSLYRPLYLALLLMMILLVIVYKPFCLDLLLMMILLVIV